MVSFFLLIILSISPVIANPIQLKSEADIIPPEQNRIAFHLPTELPYPISFTNEEILKCSDNLSGSFDIANPNLIYLILDQALEPNKSFSCRLNEKIFPTLAQIKPAKFSTAPFELLYHHFDEKTQRLRLVFNTKLNSADLQKSITLWEKDRNSRHKIRFNVEPENQTSRVFSLNFIKPVHKTEIELQIEQLPSISGGTITSTQKIYLSADTFPTPSEQELSHRPKSRLIITEPPATQQQQNGHIGIVLNLPECPQNNNPAAFIRLQPELSFQLEDCQYNYQHQEPGQRYQLVINGDFTPQSQYQVSILPGFYTWNLKLEEQFQARVKTPDRLPTAFFTNKQSYLSPHNTGTALKVTNLKQMRIVVEKLLPQNYRYFLNFANADNFYFSSFSEVMHDGIIELNPVQNEISDYLLETPFWQTDRYNSIFRMRLFATQPDTNGHIRQFDEKVIYLSDLGIMARIFDNEVLVNVNSLSQAAPVHQAKVQVYSENNTLLAAGLTDTEGLFRRQAEDFSSKKPALITVFHEKDTNFLRLQNSINSRSMPANKDKNLPYDVYIFAERELIRPGESIHIALLLREKNNLQGIALPLRYRLWDPTRLEVFSGQLPSDESGGAQFQIEFPTFYKTGNYQLEILLAGQIIGQKSLHLEDFIPPRLELHLQTKLNDEKNGFVYGEEVELLLQANYLANAAAAFLPAEINFSAYETDFKHPDYPDFTFTTYQTQELQKIEFFKQERQIILNEKGESQLSLAIPNHKFKQQDNMLETLPILEGLVSFAVFDDGRPVYKNLSFPIFPAEIVGLKALNNQQGFVAEQEKLELQTLLINPLNGQKQKRSLDLEIFKLVWHFNYEAQNGHYRWEKEQVLIDRMIVAANQTIALPPLSSGNFIARLQDPLSAHAASIEFQVGGWTEQQMPHTDGLHKVQLKALNDNLQAGDNLRLQIDAPFTGRLFLSLENDQVLKSHFFDLQHHSGQIEFPVPDNIKKGFHLQAYLLRPIDSTEKIMPFRAFGQTYIPLQNSENHLPLRIQAPIKTNRAQKLAFTMHTEPQAIIYVALVDVAILNMIEQKPPQVLDWFLRPTEDRIPFFDFYDAIEKPLRAVPLLKVGGDEQAIRQKRQKHLNPEALNRHRRPFSYWYGPLISDQKGQSQIELALPDFNGRVRIAAIAATKEKVGSTFHDLQIQDTLRLEATVPTFMHCHDHLIIPVRITNNSEQKINSNLKLSSHGAVCISTNEIAIEVEAQKAIVIPVAATAGQEIGTGEINIALTHQKQNYSHQSNIDVQSAAIVKTYSQAIESSQPTDIQIPPEYFLLSPPKLELSLSNSRLSLLQGSFQKLIDYPYGCAEQLSSKLFALLHAGKFLDTGTEKGKAIKQASLIYINETIQKLTAMQNSSGNFKMWPDGEKYDDFVSIYVADALLEAKREGFSLPEQTQDKAINWLSKFPLPQSSKKSDNLLSLYAAYILALENKLPSSHLNYLIDFFTPPDIELQLNLTAAILAIYQQSEAFAKINTKLNQLADKNAFHQPDQTNRRYYDSILRDKAFISLLNCRHFDQKTAQLAVDRLTAELIRSKSLYSTQEQAFGLRAISAYYADEKPQENFQIAIIVNDQEFLYDTPVTLALELNQPLIKVQPLQGLARLNLEVSGLVLETNQKNKSQPLKIQRTYLNREKKPLTQEITPGELIYAQIDIISREKIEQAIIVDRIPSCLEIVNPRLHHQENTVKNMDYVDIRSDRNLIFGSLPVGKTIFTLPLRAVFAGECQVPAVLVENMYDSRISGYGGSEKIIQVINN